MPTPDHADPVRQRCDGVAHVLKAMARELKVERLVVDIGELLGVALGRVVNHDGPDQRKQFRLAGNQVPSAPNIDAISYEIPRRKAAVMCPSLHRKRGAAGYAVVDHQLTILFMGPILAALVSIICVPSMRVVLAARHPCRIPSGDDQG